MSILYNKEQNLQERVNAALADDFKHNAIETAQNTFHAKRSLLVDALPMWEDYRDACQAIRDHVTNNLDYYVAEFAKNAEAAGYILHFAPTANDALHAVLDIVEETGALSCVKSKSMMSEEIGVNDLFEEIGVKVVETDCAEAIIQTAKDKPSHIVVPALHFNRTAIAELFRRECGYTGSDVPEEITHFLRRLLRKEFLSADIGMRGSNFLIAETGSLTLVSNEGNGRMVDSIPEIQIAVCGIDRIIPDLASLDVMMSMLPRSAVGAKITSYFTIDQGPRRAGEADGPREAHIILIDNGRHEVLGTPFQDMMRCMRCGACLNTCPVYRHITGHGYGSIYPGPMGIVLTPALEGYENAAELPYACTLCGACDDVCPGKIPLHSLVAEHRKNIIAGGYNSPVERSVYHAAANMMSIMPLYRVLTCKVGAFGMKTLSGGKDHLGAEAAWIPVVRGWLQSRNVDNLKPVQFRDWFAMHQHAGTAGGAACAAGASSQAGAQGYTAASADAADSGDAAATGNAADAGAGNSATEAATTAGATASTEGADA